MTENHPEELELLAYADGELADPERVAAHVQACEQCGEQLRLLEDARTALREAPSGPSGDGSACPSARSQRPPRCS